MGKSNGQLRQDLKISLAKKEESGLASSKALNKRQITESKTRLTEHNKIESKQTAKIMRLNINSKTTTLTKHDKNKQPSGKCLKTNNPPLRLRNSLEITNTNNRIITLKADW